MSKDLVKKEVFGTDTGGILLKDGSNVVNDDGLTINDLDSDQMRDYSNILSARIHRDTIHQCELLYRIHTEAEYTRWENPYTGENYKTFPEFLQYEFRISEAQARRYLNVWIWFGLDVKSEEVIKKFKDFGITKLKELVDVVDESNMDEWYEKASTMNNRDLADACRRELLRRRGKVVDDEDEDTEVKERIEKRIDGLKSFMVKFDEEQMETAKNAVERAGEISGRPSRAENLDFIFQDFLSGNIFKTGSVKTKDLIKYFQKLESVLKTVKLIAVNASSGDIVYGKDTLDLSKDE